MRHSPIRPGRRDSHISDAEMYGGSGKGNYGSSWASDEPSHGRPNSLMITLPPLAIVAFRHAG